MRFFDGRKSAQSLAYSFLFLSWTTSWAASPPFKQAMIFSGKSINTALFLGMYDAATDVGKKPDLVIGACGGSIGAALVHVDSDRTSRLSYLKSRGFYTMLKNVALSDVDLGEFSQVILRERKAARQNRDANQDERPVLSDWFNFSLVHVGSDFDHLPKFDVPFTSQGTATIFVSAQTQVADVDRDTETDVNNKLFKEVYFTDSKTAQLLKGIPSPVAAEFPDSALEAQTEAITPNRVMQGVRASIADAIYIGHAELDGHSYFTGGVDLNPVPLAAALAKEVITTYPSPFEPMIEKPIAQAMFDYDPNQYLRRLLAENQASYWVDMSDDAFPNLSPRGKLDLTHVIKIESYIPDDYSKYVEAVDQQYWYAYSRTLESLLLPKRDLHHIRKPMK